MNKFLDMKNRFPALISLAIILFILFGGCLQSSPAIPAPVPTLSNTNPPIAPTANSLLACSLEPGPTQIIPASEAVSVTVNRNTITENPSITVAFDGGLGLGMVTRMNVSVIRSDCVREQQNRDNPRMGDTVTLMGTTRTDRVIVVMTMTSGEQYTIIDQDYPFPPQVQ
jgi:hypothetical protein